MKALWSPQKGIVDWGLVTQYYGKDFKELGGDVHLNYEVNGFSMAAESQHHQAGSAAASNEYPVRVTGKNGVRANIQKLIL